MDDVQNYPDNRKLKINKVGIKNIKYPIAVLDRKNGIQHTIASVNIFVDLPHEFKGTHMSRFVEILNEYRGEISIKNFSQILARIKERLNAQSAHLEVEFTYFIEKQAPVSKARSLMEYTCRFKGLLADEEDFILSVTIPVTTLCPCSREISERGAHNQRGMITVNLRFEKFIWLENVIELVEKNASAGVYALLKREDEKFITEQAYENPKFAEDIVRDIAKDLSADSNITWFSVEAENFESIHNHNAYAYIERPFAGHGNNRI